MPKKVFTQAEVDSVQQPLGKDGFSNDRFDKLYGKDKNPFIGTEQDRKNRKGTKMISLNISSKRWEEIFGKKKKG